MVLAGCGDSSAIGLRTEIGGIRANASGTLGSISLRVTNWRPEKRGESVEAVAIPDAAIHDDTNGSAKKFRLASDPSIGRKASSGLEFQMPLFGARTERKKDGVDAKLITILSERILSTKKDGHLEELFIVYEASRKKRRLIGFLTSVDGRIRRTSEVSYDGESTEPSVVRTV